MEIKKISGIDVHICKRKVKNLRIKVDFNGRVFLIIPNIITIKTAIEFFNKNIDWVKGHVEKNKQNFNNFKFSDGEIFNLFGKPYVLKLELSNKKGYSVSSDTLVLKVKSFDEMVVKNYFYQVLKVLLFDRSKIYFAKWENATGLKSAKVNINKTVSRWGSCNCKTGVINLSVYLANLPEFCLNYVVLHELCHLRFANHGIGFKNMLSHYLSDWLLVKKYMKENGNKLRIIE